MKKTFSGIKMIFFIMGTVFFSIIIILSYLFYNAFYKKTDNEINKILEEKQIKEQNIEEKTSDAAIKEEKKEIILDYFNVEEIKKRIEKGKRTDALKKFSKTRELKSIENNNISFLVKFIDKQFLFFMDSKEQSIYIINFSNNRIGNLLIKHNYKEKINNLYHGYKIKNSKLNIKTIDNNIKTIANIEDKNISGFLNWFLIIEPFFYINGNYMKTILNMRTSKQNPLSGSLKMTYDIDKIFYINSLYGNKDASEIQNLINILEDLKSDNSYYNKYTMFINFDIIEIEYLLNRYINKYSDYKYYTLDITDYTRYMYFLSIKKIIDIVNNNRQQLEKNKYGHLSNNLLFENITKYYYTSCSKKYIVLKDSYLYKIATDNKKPKKFIPIDEEATIEKINDYMITKIIFSN